MFLFTLKSSSLDEKAGMCCMHVCCGGDIYVHKSDGEIKCACICVCMCLFGTLTLRVKRCNFTERSHISKNTHFRKYSRISWNPTGKGWTTFLVPGDSSMSVPISFVCSSKKCPCEKFKLSLKGCKRILKSYGNNLTKDIHAM